MLNDLASLLLSGGVSPAPAGPLNYPTDPLTMTQPLEPIPPGPAEAPASAPISPPPSQKPTRQMLREILGDTMYAIGQGMLKASEAPYGRQEMAAFGGALTARKDLDMLRQKMEMEQARQTLYEAQAARQDALSSMIPSQIGNLEAKTMNELNRQKDAMELLLKRLDAQASESAKDREFKKQLRDQVDALTTKIQEMKDTTTLRQTGMEEASDIFQTMLNNATRERIAQFNLKKNQSGVTLREFTTPEGTKIFKVDKQGNVVGEVNIGGEPVGSRMTPAIQTLYGTAFDADNRYQIMKQNVEDPSGQGDVALLFNHIGMTLGAQKGARITNAEIDRAARTRSIPQGVMAHLESSGLAPDFVYQMLSLDPAEYPAGAFLSPSQRENMLKLAEENRPLIWNKALEMAKVMNVRVAPRPMAGLPPIDIPDWFKTQAEKNQKDPSKLSTDEILKMLGKP